MPVVSIPSGQKVDLYAAIGEQVGTQLVVRYLSGGEVRLYSTQTEPVPGDDYRHLAGVMTNNSNDLGAWATSVAGSNIIVSVLSDGFKDIATYMYEQLTTSKKDGIGRIAVDPQPTSYEANEQFKIMHRMIDIPYTSQPAFRFTATDPVNIMERKINIWAGGREYLVIPNDESPTYATQNAIFDSETLSDSVNVTSVNGNLNDSGLPEHPTSGVEVKYAVLTGTDRFTINPTDQYPNGDAVQTDGNSNRANNQLLSSPNLSGVAAGQSFFLVFRNISSNNAATSGHFYLQWEERF